MLLLQAFARRVSQETSKPLRVVLLDIVADDAGSAAMTVSNLARLRPDADESKVASIFILRAKSTRLAAQAHFQAAYLPHGKLSSDLTPVIHCRCFVRLLLSG